MKAVCLGLVLAASFAVPVKADIYDASQVMSGIATRVISSKGVLHVATMPAWIRNELARQSAANKQDKKARPLMITQLATGTGEEEAPIRTGYTPRSYQSQYYMPYSGHVSRPEAETDYR